MNPAKLFAETSTIATSDAIHCLNRFLHLLKWKSHKANILDVGCGDGYVTREVFYPLVKDYIEKIYAVDYSREMIEHAKTNNNIEKIEFNVMDMGQDNCIEEMVDKFDHIFSNYSLHWILDQSALMKRFHKILKPGGQIFFIICVESSIHRTFNRLQTEGKWSKFLPVATPGFADYGENPAEYMEKLLKQTGFDVNLSICERKSGVTNDFKGFMRSLASVHYFMNHIPKESHEEYIEDFVKIACEYSVLVESPTKYEWPCDIVVCVATKK